MARDQVMNLSLDEVVVPPGRRPLDGKGVKRLAESIKQVGLRHPITVRSVGGKFHLVAGQHRLEAVRSLGEDYISAEIAKISDLDARLWEIAENLHRADLTKLQRDEQVDEWKKLVEERNSRQSVGKPGRPESGAALASRELGIDERDAQRASKVAGLTDEAKEAARETGLDDNRSALLEAAKVEPSKQADKVREIAEAKTLKIEQDIQNRAAKEVAEILAEHVPGELWDGLKANLHAAGKVNAILAAFNNLIGQSVMDRRYGEEG